MSAPGVKIGQSEVFCVQHPYTEIELPSCNEFGRTVTVRNDNRATIRVCGALADCYLDPGEYAKFQFVQGEEPHLSRWVLCENGEPWLPGSWAQFRGSEDVDCAIAMEWEKSYVVEYVLLIVVNGKLTLSLRFKDWPADDEMDWFAARCFENVTPI